MKPATSDPTPAEGSLEQWAVRQAIRAGRRPWTATLVIGIALLGLGALFVAARLGRTGGGPRPLMLSSLVLWLGAIGGGSCLCSAMLHRRASLSRVGTAWLGCVLLLPGLAFAPLLLSRGWIVPIDTVEGVFVHLTLVAITLAPALVTLLFRGSTPRPARARGVVVLLLVPVAVRLTLTSAQGLHTTAQESLQIAAWSTLAVLPVCWWMRAPSRSLRHLVLPTVAAQAAFAAVLFGELDGEFEWALWGGVPVMLLGALPFAFVARAADSLTVVPSYHAIHDWRRS